MRKPNLFIVGAGKSGTTSLYKYLNQHPDIYFPDEFKISKINKELSKKNCKEPKYFSSFYHEYPHLGPEDVKHVDEMIVKDINDYLSLFSLANNESIIGEASADYLYYYDVANDIKKFNKNSKIIIMLRNPINRAHSAYMHLYREGREKEEFHNALLKEKERINYEYIWYYKKNSLYYEAIKHYIDIFGREQIKIVLFEDFIKNPQLILKEILHFLNINDDFIFDSSSVYNKGGIYENKLLSSLAGRENILKVIARKVLKDSFITKKIRSKLNDKKIKLPIKKETYDYLNQYFINDIKRIEELLLIDLSIWTL